MAAQKYKINVYRKNTDKKYGQSQFGIFQTNQLLDIINKATLLEGNDIVVEYQEIDLAGGSTKYVYTLKGDVTFIWEHIMRKPEDNNEFKKMFNDMKTEIISELKVVIKDEIQESETRVKSYVDEKITESETRVKSYVDEKITESETRIKQFVKDQIDNHVKEYH